MPQLSKYDVIIFDCDGVILDSNQLKIDSMQRALAELSKNNEAIKDSIKYFKDNFGKSRFHHVKVFVNQFFKLESNEAKLFENKLLEEFSKYCKTLYLGASLTPCIIEVLNELSDKKLYVASGSEQEELRDVFAARGLEHYFSGVYGSPTPKSENVENIKEQNKTSKLVMIGDAVSDFESATQNNIDFVFYSPLSNVKTKMLELGASYKFPIIKDFSEVLLNE